VEQPFDQIKESMRRCAAVLRDADIQFALGGSVAAWARGGPETCHDLDFMVAQEDAQRASAALEAAGLEPERPPEGWLLKVWDGEVLVDVIFELTGVDMHRALERAEEIAVAAVPMPVLRLEDIMTARLLSLNDHHLDMSGPLQIARALREQIDWDELRQTTADSPYARAFMTLVDELGVAAPQPAAAR